MSVPTQEEFAIAVGSPTTPSSDNTFSRTVSVNMPDPIFSTVSSSVPTPMPIYSTLKTTSPIDSTIVPICDAKTNIFRFALVQSPHPAMLAQQSALVKSTTSVQSPISRPMLSPPPPFNVHLDPADMELLRKKVDVCTSRQGKVLLEDLKVNPYSKVFAMLEQSQLH